MCRDVTRPAAPVTGSHELLQSSSFVSTPLVECAPVALFCPDLEQRMRIQRGKLGFREPFGLP